MPNNKKTKDTISIPLGGIVGIVVSLLLVPLSFYLIGKQEKQYVKPAIGPDVMGLETNLPENIPVEDKIEEVVFEEDSGEQYFVRIGFNGVYRTIPHKDFLSLLRDSVLDKEKFQVYLSRRIVPYFETIFGDKETVKNSKGSFLTRKNDIVPNYSTLYDKINSSYISGITDIRVDIDGGHGPGTDGKYAEKYMEVDNSQQKLYVWKEGEVQRVIGLSGPVYGWQVYGVFPIVDKGREPIAPGGKYMPYWMAFYYSKKQDSWYGLHALIWMYKADGSKWFEPESNIYTRQSAGCIRMVLEDAKYLYENFQKGDILLIHE